MCWHSAHDDFWRTSIEEPASRRPLTEWSATRELGWSRQQKSVGGPSTGSQIHLRCCRRMRGMSTSEVCTMKSLPLQKSDTSRCQNAFPSARCTVAIVISALTHQTCRRTWEGRSWTTRARPRLELHPSAPRESHPSFELCPPQSSSKTSRGPSTARAR